MVETTWNVNFTFNTDGRILKKLFYIAYLVLNLFFLFSSQSNQPALCVKCGQETALLSNSHSDAAIQTINKLSK